MSTNMSNLTTGFVDLATYDELEKHMYGGNDSIAYFVRETRKATWFTLVPTLLSKSAGATNFGNTFTADITRAGDYLLHTWLRVTVPNIAINNNSAQEYYCCWTPNVGHNLIKECELTFNDLVAARFDNYHLDFWNSFTLEASKKVGYNNMIGNVSGLTAPGETHDAHTLNIPLPFFFSRDSGVALPTAALPYNQMKIKFTFREWAELLSVFYLPLGRNPIETQHISARVGSNNGNIQQEPRLTNVQVWGNYALVSNDERKKMACAPRDILIEQVQSSGVTGFTPKVNPKATFDLHFAHSIKALFFAVRNTTVPSIWSNYTTKSGKVLGNNLIFNGGDPIGNTSITYENTKRISNMTSDFFSLVAPYFMAPSIPEVTGYHFYSYGLDLMSLDPLGSTNFGKLSNVNIAPNASLEAIAASNVATNNPQSTSLTSDLLVDGTTANVVSTTGFTTAGTIKIGTEIITYSGKTATTFTNLVRASPAIWNTSAGVVQNDQNITDYSQTFDFILTAMNYNIIRVSGGSLGFPIL